MFLSQKNVRYYLKIFFKKMQHKPGQFFAGLTGRANGRCMLGRIGQNNGAEEHACFSLFI